MKVSLNDIKHAITGDVNKKIENHSCTLKYACSQASLSSNSGIYITELSYSQIHLRDKRFKAHEIHWNPIRFKS